MKIWSRFPVFRLLIPFSAGILFCINSWSYPKLAAAIAIGGFLLAFFFTWKNWATGKYAQRWLAGIPFYFCFWGLGFSITWLHQSIHHSHHFKNHVNDTRTYLVAEISEPPINYAKGFKLFTRIKAIKKSENWLMVRGNLLIYIKDSAHAFNCSLGDQILVYCHPQIVPGPTNPGGFDYAAYLHGKGIWHQAFTDLNRITVIIKNDSYSLFTVAISLRDLLLEKLKRFIKSEGELGVAGALLLGYEDWLDPDLEISYSVAGVLHVLCVSGMHVGLIYAILAWSLSFMEKKRLLRNIRYILLIILIWFYALLTGYTPSVVRAAGMITFVIAGKWMNREANIYNLLCSSCLLLFALDPFLLMSAGFQLSFLAVCGIVFIHRLILPLWEPPNRILFRIWELISISIAAQITTFPLSLFLFHQFPNYFLIGNLVIIPLSTLVMYSGLIFLVTDWIPYLGWLFGTATTIGISSLNSMVVFLGNLPGAVFGNIYISFYELIGIYALIILGTIWYILKQRMLMFSWQLVLIFLLAGRIYTMCQNENCNLLTVYSANKQSLISIIGNQSALLVGSAETTNRSIKKIAGEHLLKKMVKDTSFYLLKDSSIQSLRLQNGFDCMIIKGWKRGKRIQFTETSKNPQLLILSGEIGVSAIQITETINPSLVVFDSSCKRKQVNKLQKLFSEMHIATYDVYAQGAFQFEIK